MPSTRRHSYDLNFKLKIVAEAEAANNNREIAREYGLSESMVRKWRNQEHVLFCSDAVKDLLDRRNVDVTVIPGGVTPVLQPLDKCINKPFKA